MARRAKFSSEHVEVMRMLTVEQIQDYLGPDIHPLPGSFSTDITQIRFDLTHDETLDHSHIFSLLMYSGYSQVPALGRFGRLRALKALNMGKAVGPLFFIRPFYQMRRKNPAFRHGDRRRSPSGGSLVFTVKRNYSILSI